MQENQEIVYKETTQDKILNTLISIKWLLFSILLGIITLEIQGLH